MIDEEFDSPTHSTAAYTFNSDVQEKIPHFDQPEPSQHRAASPNSSHSPSHSQINDKEDNDEKSFNNNREEDENNNDQQYPNTNVVHPSQPPEEPMSHTEIAKQYSQKQDGDNFEVEYALPSVPLVGQIQNDEEEKQPISYQETEVLEQQQEQMQTDQRTSSVHSTNSSHILEMQQYQQTAGEEIISEQGDEPNSNEIESIDLLKLDIAVAKPQPESLLVDDSMDLEGKEVSELEKYFYEQRKSAQAEESINSLTFKQHSSQYSTAAVAGDQQHQFDLFSSLFDEAEIVKRPKDKSNNLIIIDEESDIPFDQERLTGNSSSQPSQQNSQPQLSQQQHYLAHGVQKKIEKPELNLFRRTVLVSEPEVITEGYLTKYKLYSVRTKEHGCAAFDTEVLRRFSDFEWLYMELVNNYGGYLIPLLPEKSFLTKFNAETDSFSKNRQRGLEFFLTKILDHPQLHQAQQLRIFICSQNTEFSIIKGEAESLKTIEQKCNVVIGSMKNYFSQNIAPLFGQQAAQMTTSEKQQNEKSFGKDRQTEIETELKEFETGLQTSTQTMANFAKVSSELIKLIEEEVNDSQRLNDLIPGIRNKVIDQDVLNLQEGLLFQWQKQFHPQIEDWQRNAYAALEALNRRNEIVTSIQKDSSRIYELQLLNKRNNNLRDTEMDILQNNLQKNSLRLESITHVLLAEIRQYQTQQNEQFNTLIAKFIEMQHDFHFKKNEISHGRVPSLI